MSKSFLVDINLNNNELQNVVLQNLASAPANPKEGAYYYNTTDKKFCFYENGAWVKFSTATEFTTELAKKLDITAYNADKATLEASIAAAKKAGDDAQADLNAYKESNDAAVALKAADNAVVHLADAENITGVKTFTNGLKSSETIAASSNDTTVATTAFVKAKVEDYTYSKSSIDEKIAEKDSLPVQAEHAGEWLTTNGTDAAWSALPVATASTLGIVKVGTNLSVAADGTISTTANVASVAGKTGVVTLDKSDVGLDNVDNTTDLNKPISTATQTALDGKADKAITLAGYGIEDAYTKDEIDGKIASTFHYKGTKATYAELPAEGNQIGDVWNVEQADAEHGVKAGDNVCWNGTGWDVLAGVTDLSAYSTTVQIAETYMNKTDLAATYLTQTDAATTYATKDEVIGGSVHRTSKTNPSLTPAGGTATWSIADLAADPYAITIIETASGEEIVADVVYGTKAATIRMNASAEIVAGTYTAYIMM
nr:MAG TPA: receptor binding complex [Caudoviricetes sp.]